MVQDALLQLIYQEEYPHVHVRPTLYLAVRDLVWVARVGGTDGEVPTTHSLVDPMMNQQRTDIVTLLRRPEAFGNACQR